MTQRDLFRIAARLLAIYIAVLAVPSAGRLAQTLLVVISPVGDSEPVELQVIIASAPALSFVSLVLYLLAILVLWRYHGWLADRILGPSAHLPLQTTGGPSLGLLAIRVFGIWLLVMGLIGLVSVAAAAIWFVQASDQFEPEWSSSMLSVEVLKGLVEPVPTLLAGFLVLKLGPRWITPRSAPNT